MPPREGYTFAFLRCHGLANFASVPDSRPLELECRCPRLHYASVYPHALREGVGGPEGPLLKIAAIAGAATVFVATSACADPTYLQCTLAMDDRPGVTSFEVTLNEAANTASYIISETGAAERNLPAIFTARDVTFTKTGTHGMVTLYRVDRATLEFTDDLRANGQRVWSRHGICMVAELPQRAF